MGACVHSIDDLLGALYRRDSDQISEMFRDIFKDNPPGAIIEEILIPFLHAMGDAWESGAIDAGTEHLVSEVIRAELTVRLYDLAKSTEQYSIGFATIDGEWHEFGALIGCYLAARMRHRSIYFGRGLQAKDLARLSIIQNVKIVVVSCPTDKKIKRQFFDKLHRMLPDDIMIWIGAAPSAVEILPKSDRVVVFHDFRGFTDRLAEFSSARLKPPETQRTDLVIDGVLSLTRH